MKNKPIQYQKGYVEFYKLKFKVTPDTLIPRPETELLVDGVLNFIQNYTLHPTPYTLTVLDLGTGAGNIAISIAKNAPDVKIIATDISQKALKVAEQNAKLHGVENRITFIQSDLLSSFRHSGGRRPVESKDAIASLQHDSPDIIVTNLPYIPSERIPYLDSSVKDFEPHVALDGGEDGFGLYRKLFQELNERNWKPKLLVGEIDYTHGELTAYETQKFFPKAEIEVKKDLAHMQRILIINFSDSPKIL